MYDGIVHGYITEEHPKSDEEGMALMSCALKLFRLLTFYT